MIKKIILVAVLLAGCDQNPAVKQPDSSSADVAPVAVSSPTAPISIDRTIKRIPLGDSRLIGALENEWSLDAEGDLLSELITATEAIAILPLTQVAVPELLVSDEFIPEYASGLRTSSQDYGSVEHNYEVIRTIWRTDELHIVLAAAPDLENAGVSIAQRTDLLVLKDEQIVDGITVYYSLSDAAWGAYQLFYIDDNKQIWLQRFVNDEESIQTMESMSLAVLPNGKIRALSGVTGAQ